MMLIADDADEDDDDDDADEDGCGCVVAGGVVDVGGCDEVL